MKCKFFNVMLMGIFGNVELIIFWRLNFFFFTKCSFFFLLLVNLKGMLFLVWKLYRGYKGN